MTTYDMADYLCPANGKPLLLTSGEHCQTVLCPDGWREQRKNSLVEEFFVSATAVGRGADTSDLWRPDNTYTGTFYVQYTLMPNGSLRYGADWAARHMSVGDTFHRVCTVIVYDYTGRQLQRDDGIHSDLVLRDHHDGFTFPTGKRAFDVLELQWGGEERYYYARGCGLVGWMNLAAGTGNYLAAYDVLAPPAPVPHPIPRPPFQEQSPVPDLTPLGQYTLVKLPGSYVNVRSAPSPTGADLGDLRRGDVVELFAPVVNGWQYVEQPALKGWVSLQNGAVGFAPVGTPTPDPFRLKKPVGCAHIISSKFGVPRDYDGDGVFDDIHEGVDITRAHTDCTPLILNGADGVVAEVSSAGAYGNHVRISSVVGGQEYLTWYCHMAQMFVVRGQTVKVGTPIGVMGSTGNSSGLHLHLNVQKVGAPTPPGSPVPSVIDPLLLIDW